MSAAETESTPIIDASVAAAAEAVAEDLTSTTTTTTVNTDEGSESEQEIILEPFPEGEVPEGPLATIYVATEVEAFISETGAMTSVEAANESERSERLLAEFSKITDVKDLSAEMQTYFSHDFEKDELFQKGYLWLIETGQLNPEHKLEVERAQYSYYIRCVFPLVEEEYQHWLLNMSGLIDPKDVVRLDLDAEVTNPDVVETNEDGTIKYIHEADFTNKDGVVVPAKVTMRELLWRMRQGEAQALTKGGMMGGVRKARTVINEAIGAQIEKLRNSSVKEKANAAYSAAAQAARSVKTTVYGRSSALIHAQSGRLVGLYGRASGVYNAVTAAAAAARTVATGAATYSVSVARSIAASGAASSAAYAARSIASGTASSAASLARSAANTTAGAAVVGAVKSAATSSVATNAANRAYSAYGAIQSRLWRRGSTTSPDQLPTEPTAADEAVDTLATEMAAASIEEPKSAE
ncbi:hypothetical protein GQ42DRAFT_159849 [Ramicandelaber brevisporus]|nr:hypothetical protein GQ42DRAFT_159849 [Ramicandelaber brevisporus]